MAIQEGSGGAGAALRSGKRWCRETSSKAAERARQDSCLAVEPTELRADELWGSPGMTGGRGLFVCQLDWF